jgi:hypothetical protein
MLKPIDDGVSNRNEVMKVSVSRDQLMSLQRMSQQNEAK